MNNYTKSSTSALAEIIQAYQNYIHDLCIFSGLTLLVYASILVFNEEAEYIWLKPFSVPNLLYIFGRYGTFSLQGLTTWLWFLPVGSLRNVVTTITGAIFIFTYVGIQGLLITRAYSLSQGNRFVAGALVLSLFGGFISNVVDQSLFPGYLFILKAVDLDIILIANSCTALTDIIVFGVCIRAVWSTWKLKRETGIQGSGNDLVSILLKQTVTRFCFVCFITITFTILDQAVTSTITDSFGCFQQSLSTILTADSLLDLRRQNSAAIETRNASLPSLQFQNVLQRMHESIMVEMGNNNDVNSRAGVGDEENVDVDATGHSGSGAEAGDVNNTGNMHIQDQTGSA